MKAAVINKLGDIPRYEDFPDPVSNEGDVAVKVKAVILDYANKALATGTHFASKQFYPSLPAVVGYSGTGSLEDGSLVSFRGMKLQLGETVLINGATSVSGMLAVQIAKYLGAGRVIGTGRNPESGEKLRELGADAFINLNQPDEKVVEALKKEAGKGYDVILDYLWGHPAEVIISSFTPTEISVPGRRTRFVLIGGLAGRTAQLSGQSLLTSGLEIYGMGAQTPPGAQAEGTKLVWDMIKQGKLSMDIVKYPLKDIEKVWDMEEHGKRIVIVP